MTLDQLGLAVVPGEGLVGRWPGVVMVVGGEGLALPLTDQLIGICISEASGHVPPGRSLARAIARLVLDADPKHTPTFGALGQAEDGMAMVLHGDVELEVHGSAGPMRYSGRDAATWVDRMIDSTFEQLTLVCGEPYSRMSDPRLNMQAGIVAGRGARIIGSAISSSSGPPGTPYSPSTSDPALDLTSVSRHPAAPQSVPQSVPLAQAAVAGRAATNPVVLTEADRAERPSSTGGVIIFDDGSTLVLDGDLVVGRDPWEDDDVHCGKATAVVLDDSERSVSRVHALIRVVAGAAVLTDRGSTNGTSVALPGATTSTPLASGGRLVLQPGTRVLLGQRTLIFDRAERAQ